jgi:alpha-L-fucosidase
VPAQAPDPVSSTVVVKVKGPVEVEPTALVQDYDGSMVLAASEANLHGNDIRYESGHQRDNLGFWTNPADWADWEVKVSRPGTFEVSVEAAAVARSQLEISAQGQKVQGTINSTGDYGKFRVVKLGTLQIAAPGKVSIAVRAVKEGWQPVNVKAVRLKLVAQ